MTPKQIEKAWPATTRMLMDKRVSVARVNRGEKWYAGGTAAERRYEPDEFGMGDRSVSEQSC